MDPEATVSPADPLAAPSPSQPSTPSTLHQVFLGKDGLRAVWSVILFILLFAAFAIAVFFAVQKLRPVSQQGKPKPGAEIPVKAGLISEGTTTLIILFVTWIMAKIERRKRSYGYGGTRKLSQFFLGVVSGIALISVLVLLLWQGRWLSFDGRLIFGADALRYGALWLLMFILVGIFEESLSRGFLLFTLTRGFAGFYQWAFKTRHSAALGFWTAAFLLSIMFFAAHSKNPGESPFGLLAVFFAGMFFSFSVWWTGSIWWAIGMHAAWDWGQSFLFGVADSGLMVQHHLLATHPMGTPILSGGTTGPEGSVLVLIALGLGALIIVFTLPRGRYGDVLAPPEPAPQPAPAVA